MAKEPDSGDEPISVQDLLASKDVTPETSGRSGRGRRRAGREGGFSIAELTGEWQRSDPRPQRGETGSFPRSETPAAQRSEPPTASGAAGGASGMPSFAPPATRDLPAAKVAERLAAERAQSRRPSPESSSPQSWAGDAGATVESAPEREIPEPPARRDAGAFDADVDDLTAQAVTGIIPVIGDDPEPEPEPPAEVAAEEPPVVAEPAESAPKPGVFARLRGRAKARAAAKKVGEEIPVDVTPAPPEARPVAEVAPDYSGHTGGEVVDLPSTEYDAAAARAAAVDRGDFDYDAIADAQLTDSQLAEAAPVGEPLPHDPDAAATAAAAGVRQVDPVAHAWSEFDAESFGDDFDAEDIPPAEYRPGQAQVEPDAVVTDGAAPAPDGEQESVAETDAAAAAAEDAPSIEARDAETADSEVADSEAPLAEDLAGKTTDTETTDIETTDIEGADTGTTDVGPTDAGVAAAERPDSRIPEAEELALEITQTEVTEQEIPVAGTPDIDTSDAQTPDVATLSRFDDDDAESTGAAPEAAVAGGIAAAAAVEPDIESASADTSPKTDKKAAKAEKKLRKQRAEQARRSKKDIQDKTADTAATSPARRPSPAREWLVLIAETVLGLAVGVGLFWGFTELWKWNVFFALILSVVVVFAMVIFSQLVRNRRDLPTTLLALGVGLVVTIGPLVLLAA